MYCSAFCQLYDQNWVIGGKAVDIVFDPDSFHHRTFDTAVGSAGWWSTINDKDGQFRCFTNTADLFDSNGVLMENGDTLIDNLIYKYSPYGMPFKQGSLMFPRKDDTYWMVNVSFSDSQVANVGYINSDRIYYHIVDMKLNNGKGRVVSKKNLLFDRQLTDTHLTACKHANGRDYWLITNLVLDSTYVKFLVTPDSILGPYYQQIGTVYNYPDYVGGLVFSSDGTRFAGVSGSSKINLFDFDRCNGILSNSRAIDMPFDTCWSGSLPYVTGGGGTSLAFSPSGRYLYVTCKLSLRQFDLSDFSSQLLWKWDSSYGIAGIHDFDLMPTGKMLLAGYNGDLGGRYSIVYEPDSPGVKCQFKYQAHAFPTDGIVINNTFNYRLGALKGSGCDTIRTDIAFLNQQKVNLRLFPNPGANFIQVDLSRMLVSARLTVFDQCGSVMYDNAHFYLRDFVNTSEWPSGNYIVSVTSKEESAQSTFVVNH